MHKGRPEMPRGIRLVRWQLKEPPVILARCSVVNEVDKFARVTLKELGLALEGKNWLAGNWSVRELVNRLEQVGVIVKIESVTSSSEKAASVSDSRG
jgi:hypothetical protein